MDRIKNHWCFNDCVPGWRCQRCTAFRGRVTSSNRWPTSWCRGIPARAWVWGAVTVPWQHTSCPPAAPAGGFAVTSRSQSHVREDVAEKMKRKWLHSASQSEGTSALWAWCLHQGKSTSGCRKESEVRKYNTCSLTASQCMYESHS